MVAVTHLALARSQITGNGILGINWNQKAVTSVAAFSMYLFMIELIMCLETIIIL